MERATRIHGLTIRRAAPFADCRSAPTAAVALRSTVALTLLTLGMSVSPAFSGEPRPTGDAISMEASGELVTALSDEAPYEPRISGTLAPRTERMLEEAFPIAVEHVRNYPECRALFASLGADALEKLSLTLYYPSTAIMEKRVCQGGVAAFTFLESPQVRLCKRFAGLGSERAAVVLIHEALHYAGLSEKPRDPQGLDPKDIDRMVRKACGF